MGIFDFLKKKSEHEFPAFKEPKIPAETAIEPNIPGPPGGLPPERPMEMPPVQMSPSFPQHPQQQFPVTYSKDLEIISAKLDSIKASIEAINQRLTNLERIAAGERDEKYF